jgi:hypothetical protein
MVCGEEPRQDENSLFRHDEPNKLTKEGLLSFKLHKSPFASVSTVSRGHPSGLATRKNAMMIYTNLI